MRAMNGLTALAIGLALAGAPRTQAKTVVQPQGQGSVERIEMRTTSFWHSATTGSPFVSEWRIDRTGEVHFRSIEVTRDRRNVLRQNDVTRRYSAGQSGFQRIEALFRPVERFAAGGKVPCSEVPYTDSAVGSVSWIRGSVTNRIAFDQGCPTAFAKRVFRRLQRGEALIGAWASKGRIVRSAAMADPPDPARAK